MKVIIAGGRDFNNYSLLEKEVDRILTGITDIEVVSGAARGADNLGTVYARQHGYAVRTFIADWELYGKSAGFARNGDMAAYAKGDGMLIAFWDGKSSGTRHMINIAKSTGLIVHVFNYTKKESI